MDRIEDRDIDRLWGEHYPKSKTNILSKSVCVTIALIIENKARLIINDNDLVDKLHFLLKHYGIPKEQFYKIEKEIGNY